MFLTIKSKTESNKWQLTRKQVKKPDKICV